MILVTLVTLVNAAAAVAPVQYPSASALAKQHEGQMSFEHALQHVGAKLTLPEHVKGVMLAVGKGKRNPAAEESHALQQGGSDAGAASNALDRAKETLNNMMEETEAELDTAVLDCKSFDDHTTSILDENSRLRSQLGEEVAMARADIADAEAVIAESKGELESIQTAAEDAAATCATSIKTQQDGLAILEADLAISIKVENMTNCDADNTMTFMQCGSGYALRLHFTGEAAAPLRSFKSAGAVVAAQRAAKMALRRPLGQHAYKAPPTKQHLQLPQRKVKKGMVQARRLNRTNPDEIEKETEATDDTLEAMENLTVANMPEPVSYDPNDHLEKCSVSGSSSCPMIRDALSQLTAEVRWARDEAKRGLSEMEAECQRLATEYKQQSDDWGARLQESTVKFSTATGNLNTAEEAIRLKVEEANTLIEELTTHREGCADKIKEGAETLCGIKTIRQELYQMNGENPFIQDCEVSEWEEGECSVECGGGERDLTRTIVVQPTGGAVCPPLLEKEACHGHPCPIDCVMGDWSGWSACSKDCGGGVMQRSRIPVTEEEHGGRACGEAVDAVQCNVDACDKPCVLGDWNDWSTCTKACDWGYKLRFRGVEEEAGPQGSCPEPHEWDRLQAEWCAEFYCPPDLQCKQKMDLAIMVDGSGSVEWDPGGWEAEKKFTHQLLDALAFGEDAGAKAGIVLFSWEAELIKELTADKAALEAAVDSMSWPGWNTDTAAGLAMAGTVLQNGGRPDVSKEQTVAFLITDGNPNDMTATDSAAETLKERARLIVVPVGGYVDYAAVERWASWPSEENVLHAEDFSQLTTMLSTALSNLCPTLKCNEAMTGNGQDYVGCQSVTRNGKVCQKWSEQYPNWHSFIADWYPDAHLGDHNFCRNPDGDSTIWCYTTDWWTRWEYCDPRTVEDVPEDYTPSWSWW